ncbi:glycoside hydrolase [Hortaea werneckii]|nr:glycoside hydrolase [Hortaea werneckii]
MKIFSVLVALTGTAIAIPSPATDVLRTPALEKRQTINYVQNYNGNYANFQYKEAAGDIFASWNQPQDFVVGLGWSQGTANRIINFGGQYTSTSSSYLAVYGWMNSPLTEYYIVENYSYDPCTVSGSQFVGSAYSDGSNYKICKHTQVNQPSIVGTSTFGQYFSVRQNVRNSGSVTVANHFKAWGNYGFRASDFSYQVFAVEAFGGSGSASLAISG